MVFPAPEGFSSAPEMVEAPRQAALSTACLRERAEWIVERAAKDRVDSAAVFEPLGGHGRSGVARTHRDSSLGCT